MSKPNLRLTRPANGQDEVPGLLTLLDLADHAQVSELPEWVHLAEEARVLILDAQEERFLFFFADDLHMFIAWGFVLLTAVEDHFMAQMLEQARHAHIGDSEAVEAVRRSRHRVGQRQEVESHVMFCASAVTRMKFHVAPVLGLMERPTFVFAGVTSKAVLATTLPIP
jgi:hypothetical protein